MRRPVKKSWMVLFAMLAAAGVTLPVLAVEYLSGKVWPEPAVIDPGSAGGPPSDAVVLFDGTDLSQWVGGDKWQIHDGFAISAHDSIKTKRSFGDCQLHVEWAEPEKVVGRGQGRGNSGVFLNNIYEVQVLDSYDNKTYYDGQCGSLYKQWPPLVNACRKPGQWQTYDIIFTAPRFDASGKLLRPGYLTVLQNGVLVQNHSEILGDTSWDHPAAYTSHVQKGPVGLQFHGNPVRFRNIWIRELPEEPRQPLSVDPNPKPVH